MLRIKNYSILFGILIFVYNNPSSAGWKDFLGIKPKETVVIRKETIKTKEEVAPSSQRLQTMPSVREDQIKTIEQPSQNSSPSEMSSALLTESVSSRECQMRLCIQKIEEISTIKNEIRRKIDQLQASCYEYQRQQDQQQCQLEKLKTEEKMYRFENRLKEVSNYKSSFLDAYYTSLITNHFLIRNSSVEFVFLAIGNAYSSSTTPETLLALDQLIKKLNENGFYILYDADSLILKEYFHNNHYENVILGISSQEESDGIWKITNPYLRLKAINSIPKIIASLDSMIATSLWLFAQSDNKSRDFYAFGNTEMWENSLKIWNGWLDKFHSSSSSRFYGSSFLSHLEEETDESKRQVRVTSFGHTTETFSASEARQSRSLVTAEEDSSVSLGSFWKKLKFKKSAPKTSRYPQHKSESSSPSDDQEKLQSTLEQPSDAMNDDNPTQSSHSTLEASSEIIQLSPEEIVAKKASHAMRKFEDNKKEMPKQKDLGLPQSRLTLRNLKNIKSEDLNFRSYYEKRYCTELLPQLKSKIQKWSNVTNLSIQNPEEKGIVIQAMQYADVYTEKSNELTRISRTFLSSVSSDTSNIPFYDGIVVFGSSRPQSVETYGKLLNIQLNRLLNDTIRMPIISGGGGGIMEYAQKISEINECIHIGITMNGSGDSSTTLRSKTGQSTLISTENYEQRIPLLLQNHFTVVAPGGVGTLREIATTLMQISMPLKNQSSRVLFIGNDYYSDFITWLESRSLPYSLMQSILIL